MNLGRGYFTPLPKHVFSPSRGVHLVDDAACFCAVSRLHIDGLEVVSDGVDRFQEVVLPSTWSRIVSEARYVAREFDDRGHYILLR